MDPERNFRIKPLPVEAEFRIQSIKHRLHELPRKDLELFLTEALSTMTKLANQVTQLRDYVEELEGKIR